MKNLILSALNEFMKSETLLKTKYLEILLCNDKSEVVLCFVHIKGELFYFFKKNSKTEERGEMRIFTDNDINIILPRMDLDLYVNAICSHLKKDEIPDKSKNDLL